MIYFDNASTTKINKKVNSIIRKSNKNYFGNYNSKNYHGNKTKKKIEKSRNSIAKILGCNNKNIIFTSGSTESINIIIENFIKKKYTILYSKTEHSVIINKIIKYKKKKIIKVNKDGKYIFKNIKKKTLICISRVNSETGVINQFKKKKKKNVFLFMDLSSSFGKIKTDLKNIDYASFSFHKSYGPKGVGILYYKKKNIRSIFGFCKSENGLRPGTLPNNIIIPLSYLCKFLKKNKKKIKKKIFILNKYFIKKNKNIIKINGKNRINNIINFYIKKIPIEFFNKKMKKFFSYTNSYSCRKGKISKVLKEMKLKKNLIKKSIRISFGIENKKEEIKKFSFLFKKIYKLFK
ncbi:aminotransferase class V-fold PLP-dependent enzyme [Candidatus Vidania fulgoroideorum]